MILVETCTGYASMEHAGDLMSRFTHAALLSGLFAGWPSKINTFALKI